METVVLFKAEDDGKIREVLDKDEYSREISFQIKEPTSLGLKEEAGHNYLYLKGNDEAVKKAKDEMKDAIKETKNEKDALAKMKEQEGSANVGMGFVFGSN